MSEPPFDVVTVEAYGTPGSSRTDFNYEDWTSFSLTNSLTAPAEASFELGDETGFERMNELVGLGAQFRIFVDDRLRLTGRVEQLTMTLDARQSATQRFCIRTKLSDAVVSSAPPNVHLVGRTVKEFLLAVYKDLGFTEKDFDFRGDVSRDVMTGRITRGPDAYNNRKDASGRRLADPKPGFEAITETDPQAKVQPPETIYEAADRHLRRHGMLHWDGPDGKIIVAPPNDRQEPVGMLRLSRGSPQANNVISCERDQDVSQAVTVLGMFGVSEGRASFTRAKVAAVIKNQDLIARGFQRRVSILDEGIVIKSAAEHRAAREFAHRNRGLDRLAIVVDGLSYRDGLDPVPWAPDTTADVLVEPQGGALGVYYIEETQMQRNASDGDVTRLTLVKQGVWQL